VLPQSQTSGNEKIFRTEIFGFCPPKDRFSTERRQFLGRSAENYKFRSALNEALPIKNHFMPLNGENFQRIIFPIEPFNESKKFIEIHDRGIRTTVSPTEIGFVNRIIESEEILRQKERLETEFSRWQFLLNLSSRVACSETTIHIFNDNNAQIRLTPTAVPIACYVKERTVSVMAKDGTVSVYAVVAGDSTAELTAAVKVDGMGKGKGQRRPSVRMREEPFIM
jgi:hypothetical protein